MRGAGSGPVERDVAVVLRGGRADLPDTEGVHPRREDQGFVGAIQLDHAIDLAVLVENSRPECPRGGRVARPEPLDQRKQPRIVAAPCPLPYQPGARQGRAAWRAVRMPSARRRVVFEPDGALLGTRC